MLFILGILVQGNMFETNANQLKLDLLTNYNRDTLPIQSNYPLNLSLSLNINSISVNQVESEVYYDVWFNYQWNDYQLSWDKDIWGIDKLTFNTNPDYETSVWIPDIALYNSVESPMSGLIYTRLNVDSYGNIRWTRSGRIKSSCDLVLDDFPYDSHNCYLNFGSLSITKTNLEITQANVSINNYNSNNEWNLNDYGFSIKSEEGYFNNEEFSVVNYNINIGRVPSFYETYLIFPIFCLATIILFSCIIPINAENRISFSMTVILSIMVYLSVLSEQLPKTHNNPTITNTVIAILIFSLFDLVSNIILASIYLYQEEKEYNPIMRMINKCKKKTSSSSTNTSLSRNDSYIIANFNRNIIMYYYVHISLISVIFFIIVIYWTASI